MTKILETENKEWGLWGTARRALRDKRSMESLWKKTAKIIQKNSPLTPEETQKLMDSRWGRHIADRYVEEIRTNVKTFINTIERHLTKERIINDYRYYVDEKAYQDPIPQEYYDFCKELENLSRKYGIVIQAVGGVRPITEDFNGYNPDLDSGDLIPEWED